MKKKEIIGIVVILVIAVLAAVFMKVSSQKGDTAVILVDGKVYQSAPLNQEKKILIETENGSNQLEIQNGYVKMTEADCPDKICVSHKKISKDKETIVCLPHKVVVEITSSKENELDAVAK